MAAFTFTLWRSTEKLWRAGQEGRDDVLRSIRATEAHAAATQSLVTITERMSLHVNRPYLIVKGYNSMDALDDVGEPAILVSPAIENIGKTPAKNINVIAYKIIQKGFCPDLIAPVTMNDEISWFDIKRIGLPDIGAGYPLTFDKGIPIKTGLWPDVESGRCSVFVVGLVEYRSVFEPERVLQTEFCTQVVVRFHGMPRAYKYIFSPIDARNRST